MPTEGRRLTDGSRILVVEDNDDLRVLMQMALEGEGYRVTVVRSAEDGLRQMERRRFDLVLTDYALPANTGAWLLREAVGRRLLHGAATLLVTADPDAPEIDADTEVIAKPVDFDEFLPQIRAILADGLEHLLLRDGRETVADRSEPVELVLYISPQSIPCTRAVRVMRDLLGRYDTRQVRFSVCDMTEHPEHAERDRIIFTPTLVKRTPPPNLWVLGDISNPEVVTDLLHMCGVEPVTSAR